jgi:hypothetical protein
VFLYKWFTSLLLLFSLLLSGNAGAAEIQSDKDSSSSVHATLSAMSDEQVRQLLIEELQEDALAESESFSFEPEFTGPGAPLEILLNELNDEAGQSDNQLRKLFTAAPNLLADLYKIFVSL